MPPNDIMSDKLQATNSEGNGDSIMRSSKILSVKSTPDGDIQTVEETTAGSSNNDSVKAFTHHLRDSWDEVVDECVNDKDAYAPQSRHKQNLSVQFHDFSISDRDVEETTLETQQQPKRAAKKETIEGSATFYFNRSAPATSTSVADETKGEKEEEIDDKNSFTKNIQSSWDNFAEGNNGAGDGKSPGHKPNPSVQFLDSTVLEFSAEDLPRDVESSFEEQQPLSDVNPPAVFEPPAPGVALSPIQSSDDEQKGQNTMAAPNEGGVGSIRSPPFQPHLGADSPLSPRSEEDIVVPIPHRPTAPSGGSGVSRKHRRVFSGRSNPAMSHRRVNTRGDKCAPLREFRLESSADEGSEEQQRGKKAFTSGSPPKEQNLQRMPPERVAMPPPMPPHQAPQPPNYYHGTPPPSYDPYGGYPPQQSLPQAPYPHGTPPPPPPAYYGSSPHSDAGISYGAQASPVVSGYPPQQPQPPQPYQQYPPPAPVGYYPNARPPPGRSDSNASTGSSGYGSGGGSYPQPPRNLDQTSLEVSGYAGEMLAAGSFGDKNGGTATEDSTGGGHQREPSFNPLPFRDGERASHHRKQSSLGSFLADTNIFEDADIFVEDEGYASAPEEGDADKNQHNREVSSMSFMRSLSSDDFLRQVSGEQRREVQPWQQQQLARPQYPPQPSPPLSGPPPPNGYPPQQASPVISGSPVVSGPGYVPTPPGSVTGSLSGYPPTPPGYYQYQNTPPQHGGWYPQHQGTPPQSMQPPPMPGVAYTHGPPPMHQPPPHMPPPPPQLYQQSQPPPPPVSYVAAPPSYAQPKQQQPKAHAAKARRKCSHEGCPNRVVQGGLCIAHGANRKKCSHPGCTKNVKKAGLCSTHGPARKRCEAEGCTKVAVQGGRCIAHGAKKKVCAFENCQKQAIMQGYCKRHHDEVNGVVKVRGAKKGAAKASTAHAADAEGGGHQRGLSLFQDEDLMDAIYNNGAPAEDDGLRGLSIE